jgi:uncharacterized protein
MIIDFHTHILSPAVKANRRRYLDKDNAFAAIYSSAKAKIVTAEDLIAAMDENGIDVSVIVNYSWSTHEFCVETNDYLLASATKYPTRLKAFCSVNSFTQENSLKEIERCAKAGAKGIGELRPDLMAEDYTQKNVITPFASQVKKYTLMVLTHASEPVGHIYPGKGTVTPEKLFAFISCLAGVPVICAHWGGGLPFYAMMPEVRTALEDVYFDTAASPYLYLPEIYSQIVPLVGSDRILFGSDYPVISARRVMDEIKEAPLSALDKEEILSGNARRLLGI